MCAASPISAMRSAMKLRATAKPSGKARRGPATAMSPSLQAEALFEFGVKCGVVERDDALGFGVRSRSTRSRSDARLPLQRQDRERTGRQEMLLGAAVMIALMRDRGDDGGLVVDQP